jgi:aminopeptidase-like protein
MSDGNHSLLEIARQSKLPFEEIRGAADALEGHALVERVTRSRREQSSGQ